jgi:hypothetical protein
MRDMNMSKSNKSITVLSCLLMSLFTACGSSPPSYTPVVSIDPQFQSYVTEFQTQAQNQNKPIVITSLVVTMVSSLGGNITGQCTQTDYSSPLVQIGQDAWDSFDQNGQQELIDHELGHCVLNRVHRPVALVQDNIAYPITIMYPYFFDARLITANMDQFYHELFWQTDDNPNIYVPAGTNGLDPSTETTGTIDSGFDTESENVQTVQLPNGKVGHQHTVSCAVH